MIAASMFIATGLFSLAAGAVWLLAQNPFLAAMSFGVAILTACLAHWIHNDH